MSARMYGRSIFAVAAICSVALTNAGTTPTGEAYTPRDLSGPQASADIALMRRALETIHPGLYRYRTRAEIDTAFAHLESIGRREVSDLVLWREISLTLAQIHCDHTKAETSAALDEYRHSHATHLPLRFRLVEGRMIVVSNDGQAGAPSPGAEIVSLNDMPVPKILATLGSAIAYDGSTDQAIAAKLESDGDLLGDDFNEYWPAFYGFPTAWRIQWKESDDLRLRESNLKPIAFKAWTELKWNGSPYRDEFYKSITWRLAGKSAYLRINTFVNYRNPVDATRFLSSFFEQLKNAGTDHLVLDLRENGGGSEDVSLALGRHLFAERFTWSKPVLLKAVRYGDLPQYMETWGDRKALFEPPLDGFKRTSDGWWQRLPRGVDEDDESVMPQEPAPDRFTGRVTVITGPRNGSGATRTIAQLHERLGARLVGEESAGSAEGPTAGHIFLLTLPNSGIKIRIPNAWNRTNISKSVSGRGVAVDEPVTPTLADFETGRDRALEIAKGTQGTEAPASLTALSGDWKGALDYRDYRSDERVILPLVAAGDGNDAVLRLHFSFDDGPGKIVESTETWSLSEGAKTLGISDGKNQEVMSVIEYRGGPGSEITLVAEGSGVENDLDVMVRTIVTRRGGSVSISRLTRRAGEPFILRHVYRLTRQA